LEFAHNTLKGLCSICGNPLGFSKLGSREYYCYKCENYEKLAAVDCVQSCNRDLKNLRDSFRDLVLHGDAKRYLKSYLNILETIFVSDLNEIAPKLDIERKIEVLPYNQPFFITMNLAIKWILEDLNYKTKQGGNFSQDKASNIMVQWFTLFLQKVLLENDLGIFVSKLNSNLNVFYYYQFFDFYQDSLDEYSNFSKGELTPENYDEKIAKFIEDRNNPEDIIEFVKIDFPLTYICSLYNLYPNMEDRMFSFTDIAADYGVPIILKKIIDVYDVKRSINFDDLKLPGKNFFATTNFGQLRLDISSIHWSLDIFYSIFVTSKRNPMSFPLLIEFGNEIYVTPTRLKIALRLIKQQLMHEKQSNFLSEHFEIEFQNKVLFQLADRGLKTVDPISNLELVNLKDKKNGTFEIDILGYDNENIYIVECKSFHPHPFYMLKEARERRKLNLLRFRSHFLERIKPWLINGLKKNPINNHIPIQGYQNNIRTKKGNSFQISIPKRFMNISPKNIIGLYITQLNEIFPKVQTVHQLYYREINNQVM